MTRLSRPVVKSDTITRSPEISVAAPPYEGSFVVRKGDNVVTTVKTDAEGRFEVRLAPGAYLLQSEAEAEALPLLKPVEATVRAHEFTNVTLAFDSGIR